MAQQKPSSVLELAKKFNQQKPPVAKPRIPQKPKDFSVSPGNISSVEKENMTKKKIRASIKTSSPNPSFSVDTITTARDHLKKKSSDYPDNQEEKKEEIKSNNSQSLPFIVPKEILKTNNTTNSFQPITIKDDTGDNFSKTTSESHPSRRPLPPILGPPPKKPAKLQNVIIPTTWEKASTVDEKKSKMAVPLPPVPPEEDEPEIYDDVTNEERAPSPIQELTEEEEMGSKLQLGRMMGRSLPEVPSLSVTEPSELNELVEDDVYDMVDKEDNIAEDDIYECFDTPSDNISEELPKKLEKDTKELVKKEKKQKKGIFSQEKEKIVVKDHLKVKKEKAPPKSVPIVEEEIYDDVEDSNLIRSESQESLTSLSSKSSVNLKEEGKVNKDLEKEKKKIEKEKEKREKREKKEEEKKEKERTKLMKKAKEKELKEIKKKYNLKVDEIDTVLGHGTVITNSTGDELGLAVYLGDTVTIIRMEGNPPNKWLAKDNQGKIGYIEAGAVEMDKIDEQEVYDDVQLEAEGEGEEIYEDVVS